MSQTQNNHNLHTHTRTAVIVAPGYLSIISITGQSTIERSRVVTLTSSCYVIIWTEISFTCRPIRPWAPHSIYYLCKENWQDETTRYLQQHASCSSYKQLELLSLVSVIFGSSNWIKLCCCTWSGSLSCTHFNTLYLYSVLIVYFLTPTIQHVV